MGWSNIIRMNSSSLILCPISLDSLKHLLSVMIEHSLWIWWKESRHLLCLSCPGMSLLASGCFLIMSLMTDPKLLRIILRLEQPIRVCSVWWLLKSCSRDGSTIWHNSRFQIFWFWLSTHSMSVKMSTLLRLTVCWRQDLIPCLANSSSTDRI